MKKITLLTRLLSSFFLLFLMTSSVYSQCINTTLFGNAVSNNSGNVQGITTCAYSTVEYSQVSGLTVGQTYRFISSASSTYGSGPNNFVTVTDGANNVLAFGTSPVLVTNIQVTTARIHMKISSACDGAEECNNTQVQLVASCNQPTAVTSSLVTTTSASIGWTAPATAPANGYNYIVSTSNTAPTAMSTATGSTAAGTTNAALSGLTPATQYYVFVRSVCSATDSSSWTQAFSFTTLCLPLSSFPWIENFDGLGTTVGTTSYPPCWSRENGDWSSSNATVYNTARSGANYIRNAWSSTNEYMWTPGFTLTAGTSYDFSYWTQGDGGTGWIVDTFMSTSQSSTGAAPTQLGTTYAYPGTGTYSIQPYALISNTFTPTTTSTYYFAVRVNQPASAPWYVAFDDFRLEPTPSCVAPTAVVNSAVTATGATVSWTAPATAPANGYSYFVSTTNTTPAVNATASGTVASGTSVVLSSLNMNTIYYVWVRTVCSASDSSPWAGPTTFNTTQPPSCSTVITPADGATNVPVGAVTFSWSASAGATSYDIFTGPNATTVTTLVGNYTTTSTTLNVNGFSTTIYWKVVPKNAGGSATGCPVWSFTTVPPPPAPANDECSTAVAITPGGTFASNPINGTCASATNSTQANPTTCFGYSGGDVWYTVIVPASGSITIETGVNSTTSTGIDTVVTAYSSNCTATTPVQVGCDDDGAAESAIGFSKLSLTGQVPGSTLYLRVYEYNNDNRGAFSISAYDASLSNAAFGIDNDGFSVYPNPVTNILNVEYSKEISTVAVFNLLGQEVLSKAVNTSQSQIDMSSLSSGTYLVKVQSENLTKTIKVNKL